MSRARSCRSSRRSTGWSIPTEETRKAAAEALAATFKENLRLFTHITNVLAKDKSISDEWRGFKDVAAARHLSNRVEPEVVDALVAAVRAAYPRLSHRYYALKARWLGKEKLEFWDRNAPLPESSDRRVPWDEARQTVLGAYGGFAPDMATIAERFFDKSWIDAPTRPGKAPGAFAHPTVPSVHPYVLLNYQGKTRDVMTLAHELGHGVHQVLAADQGLLMSQTPLTLAETASVFGEMLTFRAMLDRAEDKRERKIMLASKVEDMINTVVRQIAFYSFERDVHLERKNGELTAERLGEIWLNVQSESLGPAIRLGPGYETFWTYIPHFIHSPFYVYAYAFGDCLVNSLYAVYERAESGLSGEVFRHAEGRRHQAPQGAARALRPRRERPRLLADGAFGDRGADRRAGGAGEGLDAEAALGVAHRRLRAADRLSGSSERCRRSGSRRSRWIASASDVATRSARGRLQWVAAARICLGGNAQKPMMIFASGSRRRSAPHEEACMRERVGVHVGENDDRRLAEIGLAKTARIAALRAGRRARARHAAREAARASPLPRHRDCRALRRQNLDGLAVARGRRSGVAASLRARLRRRRLRPASAGRPAPPIPPDCRSGPWRCRRRGCAARPRGGRRRGPSSASASAGIATSS